jgi:hypothetical protein
MTFECFVCHKQTDESLKETLGIIDDEYRPQNETIP